MSKPQNWKRGILDVGRTQLKKASNVEHFVFGPGHVQQHLLKDVSSLMQATLQVLNSHACLVTAILDKADIKHFHDHRKFQGGYPCLVGVAQQSQDEHSTEFRNMLATGVLCYGNVRKGATKAKCQSTSSCYTK